MTFSNRFGPKGCPTLHGVASCVDYATAYMGAWAGVIALYVRETQGSEGISSGTSLALVASLMQFTHLGDGKGKSPPEGPKAIGPNPNTRTYQLKKCPDKWVFVVADKDLTDLFVKFESVKEALTTMKSMGFQATEVRLTLHTVLTKHLEIISLVYRFFLHGISQHGV